MTKDEWTCRLAHYLPRCKLYSTIYILDIASQDISTNCNLDISKINDILCKLIQCCK